MQGRSASNYKGFDISNYQTVSDWNKVKAAGFSWYYAKASEGVSYADPKFVSHIKGGRSVGLLAGAYHFARPEHNSAVDEANHFINILRSVTTDLMPVLDLEMPTTAGVLTDSQLVAWARTFCDIVEKAIGKKVMIYTGNWFVNQYGLTGLNDRPLWVANYSSSVPDCGGWTRWTAWQYSDKGVVDGIGTIDVDVAESLDELKGVVAVATYATVTKGSNNADVKMLQTMLNALGFPCGTPDGVFGNGTLSAAKRFQTVQGLPSDGVVGAGTWAAIENPKYTTEKVEVNGKPYLGITVVKNTYVIWTAMDELGTVHSYKGNGLMTVNGVDVQGVVYHGDTYIPWDSLAKGIVAVALTGGGFNFTVPAPVAPAKVEAPAAAITAVPVAPSAPATPAPVVVPIVEQLKPVEVATTPIVEPVAPVVTPESPSVPVVTPVVTPTVEAIVAPVVEKPVVETPGNPSNPVPVVVPVSPDVPVVPVSPPASGNAVQAKPDTNPAMSDSTIDLQTVGFIELIGKMVLAVGEWLQKQKQKNDGK